MGKKLTHWTKDQKQEAAIHYAIYGSLAKIERDLGIPEATVGTWKRKDDAVWVETVAEVQGEKGEEHRAMYVKIVDKAQKQVIKALPKANAAQANLIACQATDKVRLHDNLPTAITDHKDNRAMAEACKELSRTMRKELSRQRTEKQINVVAVQEKSEEVD